MIHSVKSICVAVFICMDVSPPAAALGFKCLQLHFISAWTQPLDIQCWVYKSLEHQLSRGVKLPCDEEFLFARFCRDGCLMLFCGHGISPFFEFPVQRRQGDQTARSKNARTV